MPARALIVDDEAPAREELRYLLEEATVPDGEQPLVQVIGEATNGEEALVLLSSLAYDIVFLDIRMPGLDGLQVAERLRAGNGGPKVVFTTAYPDHAVDAFDLAASDYLVKPFDATRLNRAVERALGSPDATEPEPEPESGAPTAQAPVRIPVHHQGRTVLVDGEAIVYAAADHGYSALKLAEEKVLVSLSLNELERRLQGSFQRVHRSYLVNLRHVREVVPGFGGALVLVMDDRQRSRVEVARRQAREVRKRLLG